MKILFVYPRFERHAESNPELLDFVPMDEYLGSPSLAIASLAAVTPADWEIEFRDDRLAPADTETDADLVALSIFTPAATRAMELGDAFRAMGKTVVAGGIFATGMPEALAPHFDSVVTGEGEDSWLRLLADFQAGQLAPRYERMGPVDLESLPLPRLDLYFSQECERFKPDDYPLQISRGCSLTCHACMLPAVMGCKQRPIPMEHVIGQFEQLHAAGKRACLTEDTSWFPGKAGRSHLSKLLDHVIETERRMKISYIGISMPLLLVSPQRFLDKAKQAGVDMFYLVGGFDPITMKAFSGKDQKAWQRGVDAVKRALDAGIEPYTSFLLGGDQDDLGTVDQMLEFAAAAGIRKAEFAIATPYPGTPQWYRLEQEGRILTREWRKYNDANVVFQPAQMSPEQLHEGYLRLWREFYADKSHLAELPKELRTIQF